MYKIDVYMLSANLKCVHYSLGTGKIKQKEVSKRTEIGRKLISVMCPQSRPLEGDLMHALLISQPISTALCAGQGLAQLSGPTLTNLCLLFCCRRVVG